MARISGRRFFHGPLPVKRAARAGSSSGMGESWSATARTCSGSVAGQGLLGGGWQGLVGAVNGFFRANPFCLLFGYFRTCLTAADGFWNSGRSQRMWPVASSAARSALRATRRSSRVSLSVGRGRTSRRRRGRRRRVRRGAGGGRRRGPFRGWPCPWRQRFAAAQFGQDVVHAGQRQVRVGGLLALAVGVELLGEGGDAGLLFGAGGREGKWIEAAGFVVAWIDPPSGCRQPAPRQREFATRARRVKGVVLSDGDKLACRGECLRRETERSGALRFRRWRCSVVKAGEQRARHSTWLTKNPPVVARACTRSSGRAPA